MHTERMEPKRIPKQLLAYTPGGTRCTGRPNLRWRDRPILQRRERNRNLDDDDGNGDYKSSRFSRRRQ
jgi:hypothetical protein